MVKNLEKLYAWGLIVVFAGIIVHTPLTVWLGTLLPDYAQVLKSWKEIILFCLIPLAVWQVTRHHMWQELAKDWIFRLIIGYAVLHFVLLKFMWQGAAPTLAGIGIDLRYLLFFALVYTLIRLAPRYKKLMLYVALGGAIVVTGFATLQLFLPADILTNIGYGKQTVTPYQTVDENPDYIRVNSTLRGPNPLGAYAAAALVIAAAFIATQKKRLKNKVTLVLVSAVTILSAIGLWVSYSRSSLVAAMIGIGAVVAVTRVKDMPRSAWIAGCVIFALGAGGLFIGRETGFVQNVILHDNPTTGASITSNADHITSLRTGLERLLEQPFGAGVGSTGSASLLGPNGIIIENQYLYIAHESGWIGLALYMGIFVLVLWRLIKKRDDWLALGVFASGVTLGLIGLLLPVWADDTVSIIWWGLAAIVIGGAYGKKPKSKQKTT